MRVSALTHLQQAHQLTLDEASTCHNNTQKRPKSRDVQTAILTELLIDDPPPPPKRVFDAVSLPA